MSEHGAPASDRGRPVLRWAAPTRGYVIAAAASVLITNGAGVVWQVSVVGRARRPRPWAPGATGSAGVGERTRERQPRDGEERRAPWRAVWCGVLPQRRRWQRIAALRLEVVGEPEAGSPPARGCP